MDKNNLLKLFVINRQALGKLLEDITEEESLFQPHQSVNHIRWLTGHLAGGAGLILLAMGKPVVFSETSQKLFGGGQDLETDPEAFPSQQEIKASLFNYMEMREKALAEITEADLDKMVEPVPGWKAPAGEIVSFMTEHEFYHAGQIAMIRRILGRERSFG